MSALLERLRRLLPAAWVGMLAGVALIAAPAPFALLSAADAGRVNGRLFITEAWASIGLGLLLWALERGRARRAAAAGQGSVLSVEMVLILAVLLCTFIGSFGLQPMMAAARSGTAPLGFAQLHALSVALFGLRVVLVAALAWRAAAPR